MAMSGADGKRFSLDARNNLSGRPAQIGGFLRLEKILPPLVVATVALGVVYMGVNYMRRK